MAAPTPDAGSTVASRNPVLNPRVFAFTGPGGSAPPVTAPGGVRGRTGAGGAQTFSVDGTVSKTAILLLLLVASAGFTFSRTLGEDGAPQPGAFGLVIGAALVGFVIALVITFRPNLAPVASPIYALVEGVFVGGISAVYSASYGGIVPQAVGLTVAVLAVMLVLYRTRVIRVTQRFRSIVVTATGGILVLYLATFALSLFGVEVPFLHDGGPLGIGISLLIVGIAAANLLLDFDFIEQAANGGADPRLEWYGAFGLVVTLVWLYLEILRLLSRLRSN